MTFVYSDGGRSNYFLAPNVGDCVCRAICNAGGYDYKEIYRRINAEAKKEDKRCKSSARDGVWPETTEKVLSDLGWVWHEKTQSETRRFVKDWLYPGNVNPGAWHPVIRDAAGGGWGQFKKPEKYYLRDGELPDGDLIVSLYGGVTCLKDGVIYDTTDLSRFQNLVVYGYWTKPDGGACG
jgi:hypothetical protein